MTVPSEPTTGTREGGVPVVDITATVAAIRDHAEQVRRQQDALLAWAARYAASMERRAAFLDNLSDVLEGGGRG